MRLKMYRPKITGSKFHKYPSHHLPSFSSLGGYHPATRLFPFPQYNTDISIRQDILKFWFYCFIINFPLFQIVSLSSKSVTTTGYYTVTTRLLPNQIISNYFKHHKYENPRTRAVSGYFLFSLWWERKMRLCRTNHHFPIKKRLYCVIKRHNL